MTSAPGADAGTTVDFDLAGLGRLRLIGPSPRHTSTVGRELGVAAEPARGRACLTVRFVDQLHRDTNVQLIGLNEAAVVGDAYLVLTASPDGMARTQIALDRLGEDLELVCERGVQSIPLLLPVLSLRLLADGVVALPASAVLHRGLGIVATGWPAGGMLDALLAYIGHRARPVAADCVYLRLDEPTVTGFPRVVNLDHRLAKSGRTRGRVAVSDRLRGLGFGAIGDAHRAMPSVLRRRLPGVRHLDRAAALLASRANVTVAMSELYGPQEWEQTVSLDRLLLLERADIRRVVARPIDSIEVAGRMRFVQQHERRELIAHYHRFRFAFPHKSSPLLDAAPRAEARLLRDTLQGRPARHILVPPGIDAERLFSKLDES